MKRNYSMIIRLMAIAAIALMALGTTGVVIQYASAATTNAVVTDASKIYAASDYAQDWKGTSFKTIKLNGGTATVAGSGVAVKGSSITISASGTYVVTGTLTDGSIVVNVDKAKDKDPVVIVLNGAAITSKTSAPIYIVESKKTVILLADSTANSISQGSAVAVNADEEPSSAVFSKSDLTITGTGSLTVKSQFNDGITSKDDLIITGGKLTVDAVSDGLVGKDSVNIAGGTLTITAGKDGIRSTNDTDEGKGNVIIHDGTFTITAANDGIQAENVLYVKGGQFTVTTGGGYPGKSINSGSQNFGKAPGQPMSSAKTTTATAEESKKGLKAGSQLIIEGGNLKVSSYDDAIHSNLDITINGGSLQIESGDDGIHAENSLTVNSGTIKIKNCYEGLEGTTISINGGDIDVNASDDATNVNVSSGKLTISAGTVNLVSAGDGLDANGSIVMTGGTVYVDGPVANNNSSIDYDRSFTISGGVLVASGSSGMAQAPGTGSSQASILMYYSSAQAAGTQISLKDSKGNTIISFTPTKSYASVAISSPALAVGSTYALYAGTKKIVEVKLTTTTTYLSESGVMASGTGGGMMPPGGFTGKAPR